MNRDLIDLMERERWNIEYRGSRQAAQFGFRIRQAVMRAIRAGEPIGPVIQAETAKLRQPMLDAMEAAHLQGRLRSTMTARTAKRRRSLSLANVQAEAIQFVQDRLDLSDAQLAAIRAMYNNAVASFSGDLAGSLERAVGDAIARATGEGLHLRDGMRLVAEAFDKEGITPTNSYQVESIFRTQTSIAYNAGRWNANQEPEIQEILYGYEYVSVGDDRVRPTHAALDGLRRPKDDPVWQQVWPPNGYGCRCSTLEIFVGDREAKATPLPAMTKDERGNLIPVKPDEGWEFNVGNVLVDGVAA